MCGPLPGENESLREGRGAGGAGPGGVGAGWPPVGSGERGAVFSAVAAGRGSSALVSGGSVSS